MEWDLKLWSDLGFNSWRNLQYTTPFNMSSWKDYHRWKRRWKHLKPFCPLVQKRNMLCFRWHFRRRWYLWDFGNIWRCTYLLGFGIWKPNEIKICQKYFLMGKKCTSVNWKQANYTNTDGCDSLMNGKNLQVIQVLHSYMISSDH